MDNGSVHIYYKKVKNIDGFVFQKVIPDCKVNGCFGIKVSNPPVFSPEFFRINFALILPFSKGRYSARRNPLFAIIVAGDNQAYWSLNK